MDTTVPNAWSEMSNSKIMQKESCNSQQIYTVIGEKEVLQFLLTRQNLGSLLHCIKGGPFSFSVHIYHLLRAFDIL